MLIVVNLTADFAFYDGETHRQFSPGPRALPEAAAAEAVRLGVGVIATPEPLAAAPAEPKRARKAKA